MGQDDGEVHRVPFSNLRAKSFASDGAAEDGPGNRVTG